MLTNKAPGGRWEGPSYIFGWQWLYTLSRRIGELSLFTTIGVRKDELSDGRCDEQSWKNGGERWRSGKAFSQSLGYAMAGLC